MTVQGEEAAPFLKGGLKGSPFPLAINILGEREGVKPPRPGRRGASPVKSDHAPNARSKSRLMMWR